MFILKRKNPALLCIGEEEVETDLLLQNNLRGSSIDYRYAYSLGLTATKPRLVNYTDETFDVEERVEAKIKVTDVNDVTKTFVVVLALVAHLRRDKATIKLGRNVISEIQAYLDFND